jgi:HEAT repeat protein
MAVLAIVLVALVAANALLIGVIVWRRLELSMRERRHDRIAHTLTPQVLEFLYAGAPLPSQLSKREERVLAAVLAGYSRMLQGPTREQIASYFEQRGAIRREIEQLTAASAVWKRASAAHYLGDMSSLTATPALVAALADPHGDVRTAATRSLGRLRSPDAVPVVLAALVEKSIPGPLGGWTLLQIGTQALPALLSLLASTEAETRATAIKLIGRLGGAADAEAIATCMSDTSARVRREAALALGRIGSTRDVPALLRALEDRIATVRAAAALGLAHLGDARSIEPLLAHAHDDQLDVARAAAQAAAAVDPAATATRAISDGSGALGEAIDLTRLGLVRS